MHLHSQNIYKWTRGIFFSSRKQTILSWFTVETLLRLLKKRSGITLCSDFFLSLLCALQSSVGSWNWPSVIKTLQSPVGEFMFICCHGHHTAILLLHHILSKLRLNASPDDNIMSIKMKTKPEMLIAARGGLETAETTRAWGIKWMGSRYSWISPKKVDQKTVSKNFWWKPKLLEKSFTCSSFYCYFEWFQNE